jgi:hypothetical protein
MSPCDITLGLCLSVMFLCFLILECGCQIRGFPLCVIYKHHTKLTIVDYVDYGE